MIEHTRYKYIKPLDKSFFYISSDELDSDISFIKKNKIKNIIVNYLSDYKLDNIDFLSRLPDTEILTITTSRKIFCLEGLRNCPKLVDLKVNNYSNSIVDLTNNKAIEILFCEDFKKLKGLENCVNLKSFVTGKIPKKNLTSDFWKVFTNLEYMCISDTHNISSLDFLAEINVNKILLYRCKNINFSGVQNIFMEDLKIERCANVLNEEYIYENKNIKSLAIVDSFCVADADTVCKMSRLERLIITGKSYFINGDLSGVNERLEVFSYTDQKHYTF